MRAWYAQTMHMKNSISSKETRFIQMPNSSNPNKVEMNENKDKEHDNSQHGTCRYQARLNKNGTNLQSHVNNQLQSHNIIKRQFTSISYPPYSILQRKIGHSELHKV
jgi:hypothetical protein